jgi:hypothetical protein
LSIIIKDGTGTGKTAKVDGANKLEVHSITEPESLHAAEQGDAYNLNTGLISITGDATLLYVKNNEDQDLIIEAIALGSFEGITHSDDPYITLVRNPTGGDLISDATTTGLLNQNRNFGSSKTLTANFYKGKVSGTVSGGDDIAILQATPGGRSFYTINFVIPKGSSMAIKLTANLSSGSANWYAALICHVKNSDFAD